MVPFAVGLSLTGAERFDRLRPSVGAAAIGMAQRAALQYHGGVGLARDGIIERLYRALRATRIYEGSAEVMKVVIARGLLGPE